MGFRNNFRELAPARKAVFIIGIAFMMVYFALGVLFLVARNLPFAMSPFLKTAFGVVLIAYAIFRAARLAGDLKGD